MELSDFLAALRRRRVTSIVTFVVVLIVAIAVVIVPGKTYSATETLLVEPEAGSSSSGGVQIVQFLIAAAPSQIGSQRFHTAVAAAVPLGVANVPVTLSATSDQTTGLVTLTAKSSNEDAVQPWANAAGRILPTVGTAAVPGVATIIALNTAHGASGSVPTKSILAGAVILGFLLALLAALVADSLRSRPSRRERLAKRYGVPVFASLPPLHARLRPTVRGAVGLSEAARPDGFVEAVEAVRLGLTGVMGQRDMATVAVVSRRRGEGKSLVTASLAWAMAQAGTPVVAVDANLRDPALADLFQVDIEGDVGTLAGYQAADRPFETGVPGMQLVPAGDPDRHPAEVISLHLEKLLRRLAADGRLAVVDTPAFDEAAEVPAITSATDGVLLLVDERQTRLNEITPLIDELRSFDASIIGIVLNRSRPRYRRGGDRSARRPPPPPAPKREPDAVAPEVGRRRTKSTTPGSRAASARVSSGSTVP